MQENGRQRAAKIDRQYYAVADPFVIRKRWLGVLGLIAGLAYSAWLFSSAGALHVSTGDLSQPHFAWNKTGCEKCHLPNVPIRTDALGGDSVANIAKNNQQCNGTCHNVTSHFLLQTKSEVHDAQSCSSCHREHLGANRSLVDIANQECSKCHANMQSVAVNTEKTQTIVKDFSAASGHPEFASLSQDPGTIRFSHIQHMRPGQPATPGGREAKRLEMMPEKYRGRYQNRVDSNGFIQLVCSNCHDRDFELKGVEGLELGQADVAAAKSPSHRQYKSVDFEMHCAACHDMDGVPHGLDRASTNLAIQELVPRRQLEFFRDRGRTSVQDSSLKQVVEQQVIERERRLQVLTSDLSSQCTKCHLAASADSTSVVQPSGLKQSWLKGAMFSHGAHLMVSCKECHSQPYQSVTGSVDAGSEAKQVMIDGIAKCRTCHIQDGRERAEAFRTNRHVASADCVDCHRYHVDSPSTSIQSVGRLTNDLHRNLSSEAAR